MILVKLFPLKENLAIAYPIGIAKNVTKSVAIDAVKTESFKEYSISFDFKEVKISSGFGIQNREPMAMRRTPVISKVNPIE